MQLNAAKNADEALLVIADYAAAEMRFSAEAYQVARLALADSLGCAILALKSRACTKLLGPVVPGTLVPYGSRVPGTNYALDPIRAAFNIGLLVRWLDYNDTWLGKEWGHPSDNLGGLLAVADYLAQKNKSAGREPYTVDKLLHALIKAYEIQGGLSILNSFNEIGLDHVILVKVATAAVGAFQLGCSRDQIIDAVSNAWIDTGPLRTYRHGSSTGSRKSWAAGDATSRGLFFAFLTTRGEGGYPTALSDKRWGFYDVLRKGHPFAFQRPLGAYIMENVLFKPAFPAEYHAQSAVEAAIQLHAKIQGKIDAISKILIETHESAIKIIDKTGPLSNPAARDHCLQYMVAVALLKGALTEEDYEEAASLDPRIDFLRGKMQVVEQKSYSADYHDPNKRSVANALTIHFADGSSTARVEVEYPLGHPRRRAEAVPVLLEKFKRNLATRFSPSRVNELAELFEDYERLAAMRVDQLMDLFCSIN